MAGVNEARTGNLNIILDDSDSDDTGEQPDDGLLLVKQYNEKETLLLQHFCKSELEDIAYAAIISGKKHLKIECFSTKRIRVESLLQKVDAKLDSVSEKEITIPENKFPKLAEYKKRLSERSSVLLVPDIAQNIVTLYAIDDIEKEYHQLKVALEIVRESTRKSRVMPDVSDLIISGLEVTGRPGVSHKYDVTSEASGTEEDMDWSTSSYSGQPSETIGTTRLDGGMLLKIYKASILKLRVDVIVNAANEFMMHGGGVANVISEAAGPDLDKDCSKMVRSFSSGSVPVKQNIVSTAGKLRYKAVIHAVGPIWNRYTDKVKCLDDLYDCVWNILQTCEKKGFTTVGMPAISAGIFGVPKELCADMYVKAAADYSKYMAKADVTNPRELHIIDVDAGILNLVQKSVKKWQADPLSINQRLTVPKFLADNPHLASSYRRVNSSYSRGADGGETRASQGQYNRQSSREYGADSRSGRGQVNRQNSRDFTSDVSADQVVKSLGITCPVRRLQTETFKWGGKAEVFQVDKIVVKIFTGELVKMSSKMDAVVCGISKDPKDVGFVVRALQNAGGKGYCRASVDMRNDFKKKLKPPKIPVLICNGGDLTVRTVVHVMVDRVVDANKKELQLYTDATYKVFKKSREWSFRSITVPLFATGNIQQNERKLLLCCGSVLEAFDKFVNDFKTGGLKIEEVHLVNNKENVSKCLVDVLTAAASPTASHPNKYKKSVPDSQSKSCNSYDRDNTNHGNHRTDYSKITSPDYRGSRSNYEPGNKKGMNDDRERGSGGYGRSARDDDDDGYERPVNVNRNKPASSVPRSLSDAQAQRPRMANRPLPEPPVSVYDADEHGDDENEHVYSAIDEAADSHRPQVTHTEPTKKKGNLMIIEN